MANTAIHGVLTNVMRETYQRTNDSVNPVGSFDSYKVSVGARYQANQEREAIVVHNGSTTQYMKGMVPRHNHDVSVICFDKAYSIAAAMSDNLMLKFTDGETFDLQGDVTQKAMYKVTGQSMYYTDEDDYAVVLNITCTVIDESNL